MKQQNRAGEKEKDAKALQNQHVSKDNLGCALAFTVGLEVAMIAFQCFMHIKQFVHIMYIN
jgi:hypothetical protein